ncbi:YadA-like family protein [Rahnella bruchi]|nr:YadA-like family protein [Rahnella bruchi]
MNAQVTERNAKIITAYTAGKINKTELARYFGVSASTVRRVLASAALASLGMVAVSIPHTAQATTDIQVFDSLVHAAAKDPNSFEAARGTWKNMSGPDRADAYDIAVAQGDHNSLSDVIGPGYDPAVDRVNRQAREDINHSDRYDYSRRTQPHQTATATPPDIEAARLRALYAPRNIAPAGTIGHIDVLPPLPLNHHNTVAQGDLLVQANRERNNQQVIALGESKMIEQRKLTSDKYAAANAPRDGINGKDGRDGQNGKDGKNGIDGKNGANGTSGEKGATGETGANGRDGTDGKDGAKGDKGDKGDTGARGNDLTQDHYSRMNAAAALAASHVEQDEIDQNKSALGEVKVTAEQAANDSKTAQDTAEGAAKQLQMVQSDKFQRQVQAKTQAEIDASAHATEQKVAQQQQAAEKKSAIAAKQQKIESVYYGEQIQTLAQTQKEQQGEILAESHSRAVADAQTLGQANDYTNKKFNDLKSEVDGNKKEAAAGSASAMAQANIPQVQESQQFAVGAGVGGYDSENAISVGASFHASRSTIVKMSVSDDSQSNFGYGAGVSVGW